MNRAAYKDARRGYRCARRRDIEWKEPEAWAYRERTLIHQIPQRPEFGLRYLAQFPVALAETFLRPMVDAGRGNRRLLMGPRARALVAAPTTGRYSGLNLPKRVALRSAQRRIAVLAAERMAA